MRRGRERGSVTVESALVGSLFFLIVFGLMDISVRWAAAIDIEAAASAAARELSVTGSSDKALVAARSVMPDFLKACIGMDSMKQFASLSSTGFASGAGGSDFVSPAGPGVAAVSFRLVCRMNYITSPIINLLGARADTGTWAIAVMQE